MKTFAIYCSGNASRVVRFYNEKQNLEKFRPEFVVYDGINKKVLSELQTIFHENLFNLDYQTLSPLEKSRINHTTSNFILQHLQKFGAEYLICFGDKILKKNLIEHFDRRLINFHPSLLPAYPGLNAIDQARNNQAVFLGNTVHYINELVDEGEIIAQTAMLNEEFTDYEDVLELQFPLLKLVLRDIFDYPIAGDEICSEISNRSKKYLIPSRCNQH